MGFEESLAFESVAATNVIPRSNDGLPDDMFFFTHIQFGGCGIGAQTISGQYVNGFALAI